MALSTEAQAATIQRRRWLSIGLVVLVLGGILVGGYAYWRWSSPVIPAIATDGLDAEVVSAINEARAGVQAEPRSAAVWGRVGMVLFAHDRYGDAVGFLVQAEKLDPTDVRWPYLTGLALLSARGQPEEGIEALERAARVAPDDDGVQLRLAEEYLKGHRLDEAEPLFSALLARQPDNARALLGRGQILLQRCLWHEALNPLHKAARSPAAHRSARVALAEAFLRLGDSPSAETERRRAQDAGPDLPWPDAIVAEAKEFRTGLQARLEQSIELMSTGRLDQALATAQALVQHHPQSDEAHVTLAKVLMKMDRLDPAAIELRRAIELKPQAAEAHFLLAATSMKRADYRAAEESYRRAIEAKPTYGVAYFQLGHCLLKQGEKTKAIAAFRDAVRRWPDQAAAYLELGDLLLQEGQTSEAIGHLENAIRLDPDSERARGLLKKARDAEAAIPR
jgi:tetratricopeptide (TPR) repeat protein